MYSLFDSCAAFLLRGKRI